MLRTNGSDQYINEEQVEQMRPVLDQFWNSSVSWTSTYGSWTQLSFVGTDIWAFGLSGPQFGDMSVMIDEEDKGTFSQQDDTTGLHHLIYEAHDLEDGPHTLTLTLGRPPKADSLAALSGSDGSELGSPSGSGSNLDWDAMEETKDTERRDEEGQSDLWLGFDYAVIQSERYFEVSDVPSASSTSTTLVYSESSPSSAPSWYTNTAADATISSTLDVNTDSAPAKTDSQVVSTISEASSTTASGETNPSVTSATAATAALAAQAHSEALSSPSLSVEAMAASAAAAAASSSALAALLPTTYSASQYASLKEPYSFQWNTAAYFVVIFSSLVVAFSALYAVHKLVKRWANHKTGGAFRDSFRRKEEEGRTGLKASINHGEAESGYGPGILGERVQQGMTTSPLGLNHQPPQPPYPQALPSTNHIQPTANLAEPGLGVQTGVGRGRPNTRVLDALKGRRIGAPITGSGTKNGDSFGISDADFRSDDTHTHNAGHEHASEYGYGIAHGIEGGYAHTERYADAASGTSGYRRGSG